MKPHLRLFYGLIDGDYNVFFATLDGASNSNSEVDAVLRHIPDEQIYPKVRSGGSLIEYKSDGASSGDVFIKRPNLNYFGKFGSEAAITKFREEWHMAKDISGLKHPNIVEFKGVILKRGFLVGLAYELLEDDLSIVARSDPLGWQDNREQWMVSIDSALEALHEDNKSHNDVQPEKILTTVDGMVKLVGFSTARSNGALINVEPNEYNEHFRETGGDSETARLSVPHNDRGALRITRWSCNQIANDRRKRDDMPPLVPEVEEGSNSERPSSGSEEESERENRAKKRARF